MVYNTLYPAGLAGWDDALQTGIYDVGGVRGTGGTSLLSFILGSVELGSGTPHPIKHFVEFGYQGPLPHQAFCLRNGVNKPSV